jgi:phosphate-selective porin OprO/OprP
MRINKLETKILCNIDGLFIASYLSYLFFIPYLFLVCHLSIFARATTVLMYYYNNNQNFSVNFLMKQELLREMKLMNMKKTALAAVICTVFTPQVQAGSELRTLIRMLHENGTVDDEQYERLLDEINTEARQKEALQGQQDDKSTVDVIVNKGGLQAKSRDKEFAVKIGGRIQVDSAWYDEDGSEMGNGTELRRARIHIQGYMFRDWGYKFSYDFTGTGKGGIKDALISYNGFDHVQLKVGSFKDPFMLQEQTSSKYITFTERSLLDIFASGRHIGFTAATKHKHWTATAGFFGDSASTAIKGKDEGWSASGRLTYAPINEKTRVIHLGVASDYREVGDEGKVRFKQQPETHISGTNIVDTGVIEFADNTLKVGAELAIVEGPFSLQSEYIWTRVDREHGGADLDYDGWYAQAGYFLTGESRRYKQGKFGGVSPKSVVGRGGFGAWQLAARYSSIDLNNRDVDGGEADSVTVGINWFPTPTLRFSGNYVNVLDVKGGSHHGEEPSLFQVRGQWAF